MTLPEELKQWNAEVSSQLPHLSRCQAWVLAMYSWGMVLTKHCGLTTIVTLLSMILEVSPSNLRQRLREWHYDADQKRGQKRCAVVVSQSFAPLLRWLLKDGETSGKLVLALDVTYLGDRFTILAISVLYRGCAIPVAWRILRGNTKGEWHPRWVELITTLQPAIPRRWQVYALTDRGLYSKRLFNVLRDARWHPLMRIRAQGYWRRRRAKTWQNLASLPRPSMGNWCQRVICFKGDPLECTLAVCWDAQYSEPWLIVTDLKPTQVRANYYALRAWIECGFEDIKRGGLHWEQTKMTDPARAERLWLIMAVAILWLVRVGGEAQVLWQDLLPSPVGPARLSCLRLGWLTILAAAFKHYPLPKGHFDFKDWPKVPQ